MNYLALKKLPSGTKVIFTHKIFNMEHEYNGVIVYGKYKGDSHKSKIGKCIYMNDEWSSSLWDWEGYNCKIL